MIKIRYLSMVVMFLLGITAYGQDTFDPVSPSEPGAPIIYSRVTAKAEPADGGSVSGGGRYAVGSSHGFYAYVNNGYKFAYWTDKDGNILSTATSLDYVYPENGNELTAHFKFDPTAPSEPVPASSILYFPLTVQATVGGSVYGGGRYQAGQNVNLSANAETGFAFVNWTNEDGDIVSTQSSFSYTTQEKKETLTANFCFDPTSPGEPDEPIVRHRVTVGCNEGGYFNGTSGLVLTGNSVTLYAYPNSGYEFLGWYMNGEFYTALSNFSYTMGTENVDFYAMFRFNPESPSEPLMPALDKYSFYLMTVNGLPGQTIEYPIYMANSAEARDMTFQLTFPAELMPRLNDVTLSDKAVGYTTSATAQSETVYVFSMIGGTLEAATTKLLTFYVDIPTDMPTGSSFQVKINQISVTEPDGTSVTARTRNGRMGVYRKGDTNGDDAVDALDSSLILQYVAHKFGDENTDFIKETANTNGGDEIDALDASLILQHAAKKIDLNEIDTTE